ncbi:glycosyl hydrolase family 18 protein [Frondihabitans cladoniiphilus]|uniref:Glycosyl hydrolase family 18 protein n=1 Tax=Frondihabitans cladoniiphilus TaxID=715785 RepID=A0ABP8VZM8_9MICO
MGCTSQASAPANTAVIPSSVAVEGYGVAGDATLTALAKDKGAIDTVGISGVSLTAQGAGVAASTDEALSIAASAKQQGVKSELLVNNVDANGGDFSAELASDMLSSEDNRQFVVAGLAGEVDHGGYDGIQIDFENLQESDAADLVAFAKELSETLPTSAAISMALPASTTADGYLAAGYDVRALKSSVARFVLMAYDEHGSGFSAAGPVGGLPWAEQSLSALTSFVSASKVDLGVAGYGYTWKSSGSGGVVTPAQARAMAGDRANWVAAQGEWTAKLADGTVLWWSDARSLTVRANIAATKKLHGVALWQMASGDGVTKAK